MKRIILTTLTVIIAHAITFAQALKYKVVQNADLTYVLNNIQKTTSFTSDKNDLFIRVYVVADHSGSAHVAGDDEITNSIYLAVSNSGEAPERHLFRLASIYHPQFVNWVNTPTGPELIINYGPANKIQKTTVHVGLKQLAIR